jgi:hypothetical protein
MSGYVPQYEVASSIVLRQLRDGTLKWVRVADPEAGRVDDLQVGSESRVDGFQVKWSQFGGPFTFKDLVGEKPSSPNLLAQLADGWTRLRAAHPGHRVVVHLVTNQTPSVGDKVPAGDPKPEPCHFASFLAQAWGSFRESSPGNVPDVWSSAWETLRLGSGLEKESFCHFVRDCELELGYNAPDLRTARRRDEETLHNDLKELAQFLPTVVADKARIVELSRDQLIDGLGWRARVEFRSRHEFPVIEELYQPVQQSVRDLEEALRRLRGGYIGVVGTPGSGKSTLLTMVLRSRPERVVRYYAYVPDARDPAVLRGESVNFLHDVVLDLERMGFRAGEGLSGFDRDELLGRLHAQLLLLHKDWQAMGRATIILVDGLDHIEREAKPERSLIRDLPQPDQVPEGVYFILGSQTDTPFPDRIQYEVRKPERRIEMGPLDRGAVFRIIESASAGVLLSQEQKEQVYALSAGHPLSLGILLKRLADADGPTGLQSVLDSAEAYQGNIEREYYSYWKQVESDPELAQLLALLGRMRTVIDLGWVRTWADSGAVTKLISLFGHYFRREDDSRWYFFHDSFRLFLVRKTAESSPGMWSPEQDRAFHGQIARICSRQTGSPWAWEELYHWAQAAEHEIVLERAQPTWFSSQLLALRPIDAIESDILLAMRSAAALKDPVALARLVLAGAETSQRGWHLERTSLLPLLLALGEKQAAVDYVRDGNRLRVSLGPTGSHLGSSVSALGMSMEFRNSGLVEEARRVFALAEPIALLSSPSPVEDDPQGINDELLQAWAEGAVDYRGLDVVINTIRRIRREPHKSRQLNAEQATRNLRHRMLFKLGLSLLNAQRWDDLAGLRKEFNTDREDGPNFWFWLQHRAWRDRAFAGDEARAQGFVKEALELVERREIAPGTEARVALAEGALRILENEALARSLLDSVSQPKLMTDVYRSEGGLQPFLQRFRLNRLLCALGEQFPASDVVPASSDPRQEPIVDFERYICVIAQIWGMAWRAQRLTPAEIASRAFPLLRFFYREGSDKLNSTSWYVVRGARGEFYVLLVDAAAQHGLDCVNALKEAFSEEWDDPENSRYWPSNVRREIIVALAGAGVERQWALGALRQLETGMFEGQDVSGRMDESLGQARAWIALNDQASARTSLKQLLTVSFGVGYRKDYQFDEWMGWLERANNVMPADTPSRVNWFARAAVSLEESTEGEAAKYAAETLLRVAFRWSPRRSIRLLRWFVTQRAVWYQDAVEGLLSWALQADAPPASLVLDFLTDAFLSITTSGSPNLVESLIEVTAKHQGIDAAIDASRRLLNGIQARALPSQRPKWRRGLALGLRNLGVDAQQVGLDATDLVPDKEETQSSGWLRLKNGSVLDSAEVQASVSCVADLQGLMEGEVEGSHFDWEPIVASLVQTLDRYQIQSLLSLFSSRPRSAHSLAAVSRRLRVLGDAAGAWTLAERAVGASEHWGWAGGSWGSGRLTGFGALVDSDPARARPLVYEKLVSDLTTHFSLVGNIALNLYELLSLLTDTVPVLTIWPEVERHVHCLFETSTLPAGGPTNLSDAPPCDTPGQALVDVLFWHLDHPVTELARSARGCLRNGLRNGERLIQRAAREGLRGPEGVQESVMMVLEAIALENPRAIASLEGSILELCKSRNYAIRRAARATAERIAAQPPEVEGGRTPLPAVYELSFPEIDDGLLSEGPSALASGLLVDPTDPLELVRPFGQILAYVARESGLPVENLLYRVSQLMRELAPENSWSPEGEKSLGRELKSASLRLPFAKPRAAVARRALFHVVGELADAGRLDAAKLQRLERELRFYDPGMLLLDPVIRPMDVPGITGRDKIGGKDEEWLDAVISAAPSACRKLTDGRIVLAEETKLKHLDWETATEVRLSSLSWALFPGHSGADGFFGSAFNLHVSEYSSLKRPEESLAIRHDLYFYESPGEHWLALNPAVGRQCTWNLADSGLFRWADGNGETMVESIWWVDGLIDQSPPHFGNEVGEGWLVVASPEAVSAIEARYGPMKRRMKVSRSYRDEGDAHVRSTWAEENRTV